MTSTSTTDGFTRLSASPLWRLQREFFETQGPRAWSTGTVPHYVTCNPYLARAFTDVILGFLADRAGDGARTVHVVELGAGSGRLAWNVVRALQTAVDAAARGWRVVYVMTDIAEATVAWWQQHPRLAPLVRAGLVDFARFDATTDDALTLRGSGRTLDAAHPVDDLVVIANYVFDSVPQDVFEARDGRLFECLAAAPDLGTDGDTGALRGTELRWRSRPAPPGYYGDPVLDGILDGHAATTGVFTFPCVALAALDRLRPWSRGALLVLSADKGGSRLADVVAAGPPPLATHGSVSMMVNYHAVGAWALERGGCWMHTEHHHRALEVCAFIVGAAGTAATLAAFERAIAQRGPDDFHALKRVLVRHAAELGLGELLAYLRLSGHDAKVFLDCAAAWTSALATATSEERADLALALRRVWDGYFPIGEGDELARLVVALARALRAVGPSDVAAVEDPFDVLTGRAVGIRAA